MFCPLVVENGKVFSIMPAISAFTESALDSICRSLADAVTHNDVTRLLAQCGLMQQGGSPKWERMLLALLKRQQMDGCGNNALAFVCSVLHPSRFAGRPDQLEDFRAAVNFQLSFNGLAIDESGTARPVAAATTLPEATRRANELRGELTHRAVHPDVLRYCRAELLEENYFHCVLEAAKSVAQKIRDRAGIEGDGTALADRAFSLKAPLLALNTLITESEQSEQKGFCHLLKGVFGTFRNVLAHAPKVNWSVNRADALDALTMFSYIHRRLDDAVSVPQVTSTGL